MLTELKPELALHCNEYIISSLYNGVILIWCSLRKQPTFWAASTGFPAKWRLRNERRDSILITRYYPDLGSVSDWSWRVRNLPQPIRSTTQIWVVTRHQYGISALVSQTSIREETSGGVAKCRLFRQASLMLFKCIKRENSFFFFQGQQNPAKIASEHIDLDIRKNNHSVNLTTVNATWSIEAWGKERPAFFK